MPTKKVTELPERVSLNLDSLERENPPEEFAVVIGGKRVRFADPQEMDYRVLMAFESDPELFFRNALGGEDLEHWNAQPMPAWKLNRLMESYRDHFGLGAPGNAIGSGI